MLKSRENETPVDDKADYPKDVPLPDYEGVRIVIARLKNNKAIGIDGYLYGG